MGAEARGIKEGDIVKTNSDGVLERFIHSGEYLEVGPVSNDTDVVPLRLWGTEGPFGLGTNSSYLEIVIPVEERKDRTRGSRTAR